MKEEIMPDDFYVEVHDQAGLFTDVRAASWLACLSLVRELSRKYPHKHVSAYNASLLDVDTDGLTDSQRDEMVLAADEGRGKSHG